MTLLAESEENYKKFYAAWTAEAQKNWVLINASDRLLLSYRRIAAFQGMKADLVGPLYTAHGMGFLNEAHNDLLVSHVSASMGAWRLALQSLRSFIENSLCAIYYNDHPVEHRNWERGKKKIGFSELVTYFEGHPDLAETPAALNGITIIKGEYKTLSIAVHASAKDFRMTDDVSHVLLWSTAKERINKWSSREGACLVGVALLFISLHKELLTGTKLTGVRSSLSFILAANARSKLKSEYKITVRDAE